jgi:hypothetical protein
LKSEVYELIRRLEAVGAHVYVPRADLDYAVGVGLRMLTLRHIVNEEEGLYRGNPADRDVLAYYANAIEPLVTAAQERRRVSEEGKIRCRLCRGVLEGAIPMIGLLQRVSEASVRSTGRWSPKSGAGCWY